MKKAARISAPHGLWFSWKLVTFFCMSFFVVTLLRVHFQYDISSSPISSSRSRIRYDHFGGPPKIAFLFLARRDLPLDFLWGSFFENADAAKFSIYVHSAPGFVFDESTTRSEFFYDRQLRNSIQVTWGESSIVAAERLLLDAALEDLANQRFVLLSDSCVPLYNFSYIYNYLMASPKSFMDSFLDGKEGRYNPKMSHIIPKDKRRKGSQWISLVRRHAKVIVDDDIIFPVFKEFCKRRPPVDARKGKMNIKLKTQNYCFPDEHYVPTLLAMSGLEGELERRTLTYSQWNQSAGDDENLHPHTFSYANATPKKIKEIKSINHVYYEADFRTEWCHNNSTSAAPCFLFARKFSRGAAMRLLSEGVVGPLDAST